MRTIVGTALGALLAVGLMSAPAAGRTTEARKPSTVAIVIMEDKDACSPTDGVLEACAGGFASKMPYLNGTIVTEGITLIDMHEGISGLPCMNGSQPGCYFLTGRANYPELFSGDLCNMNCVKSTSPNLFKQMGNSGFKVYAEDWSSTADQSSPRCQVGLAPPQGYGYSRLHNPATFWAGSCIWHGAGRTVFNFPNVPDGTIVNRQGPFKAFQGSETFAKLDVIVPSLCHDQHDKTCPSGTTNRTNAWGVIDTRDCNEGHSPGYIVNDPIMGGDLWLCRNFEGIRRDVGSGGVVILTWDEDTNKRGYTNTGDTAQGTIPSVIVPGEDSSDTPGVLKSCPSPGPGGCVDGGDFDQTSVFKTLIDTMVGDSPRPCDFYSGDPQSFDSCSDTGSTGRPAYNVRLQ
jgi:hypothetical protein